jgi:hypothetical protein
VSAPLSEQQLAEIADRVAGAASGPWRTEVLADGDGGAYVGVVAASGMCVLPPQDVDADDMAFIAAARSDVPVLMAEVGRLRARVAELEAQAATARSAALDEAADDLQQYIDTEWGGPDRERCRRFWWQPRVERLRALAERGGA